jgi:hypothetical protein
MSGDQSAVPWGSPRRYLTDDRDLNQNELQIMQGGNGDWYVSVLVKGQRIQGVRLATSGGASRAHPGLCPAIADAYRALGGEKRADPMETFHRNDGDGDTDAQFMLNLANTLQNKPNDNSTAYIVRRLIEIVGKMRQSHG